MATSLLRSIRRLSSLLTFSHSAPLEKSGFWCGSRKFSYGTVNLVIEGGRTKFETNEVEPPKKDKWKTKKRFRRKKKQKFACPEERIKYKLQKLYWSDILSSSSFFGALFIGDFARIKEALLIERLKRYEVPELQGPVVKPDGLTGEERHYLKKMAQKSSNYLQVGRRGLFGGVILNMHMHWKKHETVKVICKPRKPGQVHEYTQELARLSGGIPIHIFGNDTIIFYRGKNYMQPDLMSPIDTLSKKKKQALIIFVVWSWLHNYLFVLYIETKHLKNQSMSNHLNQLHEKELELYYRHIALYGDPNNRNPLSMLDGPRTEADSTEMELSETEDNEDENLSMNESDSEEDSILNDQEREVCFTTTQDETARSTTGSSSRSKQKYRYNNKYLSSEQIPITSD
ncbi:unnamed protein product [Lupinus luteus]|uniref:CRM domain-containing protein n=1 Tax=Lupinus luteus TaxID=3873 RepID=A0AAV1W1M3_LUPLU